ncbi:ABC transporter permease [Methanosarcina sp. Z-7115]|uniref:ABC transporter permease n=1 Tax=Methanosarcina baikalica TaxID=3073890 RepID=A0ABU2D363_9EURY|nr:ABC transporter permease [Methanosarcina sp. Z-7115]MDR7666377.1 ABC transporter permease [Methanosarcina sp. Z-7115]
MTEHATDYELVIRPKYGLLDLNWQELKEYRELLFFLALREIKIRYKQTILGASWALLQPFFTMIVFTLIFSGLAQMPSDGVPYPLFSYSGLLLWTYFSNALSQSSNSLVDNASLLSKVYMPRIFIPTAPCLSGLVDYGIAMSILVVMMIYYRFVPGITILLLPFIVLMTFLLASGIGYWLSSICVKYRDVKFVLPFFIQLLLFVSPVIYPANIVGENLQWLLYLNPMTGLIGAHRACLLGHIPVDFVGLGISVMLTIVIFVSGILYLKRTEKYFADLI